MNNQKLQDASSQFRQVNLCNRLGQTVPVELFYYSDDSCDMVIVRSKDALECRHLAKNVEQFAHQLIDLCTSNPERLQIVEWREAEQAEQLWRWRFNWVGTSPLDAKAAVIGKASHHKYINELLSSLTAAAA